MFRSRLSNHLSFFIFRSQIFEVMSDKYQLSYVMRRKLFIK